MYKIDFFNFCIFVKKISSKWSVKKGIAYVEKSENPPNAPQIRPVENYWAMLKMKVYEGNWTGKNRPQMIRRIKQKQKELDHGIVIRMFDNLKGRIHIAKENGLSSLIKF